MFVLTEVAEITSYSIAEALESDGDVKIHGTVRSVMENDKLILFTVEDESGSIDVVVFDSEISLDEGDEVEVEGKVNEYRGKKQIEARTIILT